MICKKCGYKRIFDFSDCPKCGYNDHAEYQKKEEETKKVEEFEALVTALKDGEIRMREQAARTLGIIRDARAVEPLIVALKDGDFSVRKQAATALGSINDARAVEALITVLNDSEFRVREQAARSLGIIRDSRAVEQLIAALKDDSSFVRDQAVGALGNIKGTRTVEALITTLKDRNLDMRMHEQAARALGEIGDARAVDPLVAELKNLWLRKAALEALEKIGGLNVEQAEIVKKAKFEALMQKFLHDGVELERGLINRFASAYGTGQFNTTNDLSEIKETSKALQSYGLIAVDCLCEFLENNIVDGIELIYAGEEAISALGNLGDKKAIEAIKKFVSRHSSAKKVAGEALRKISSNLPGV